MGARQAPSGRRVVPAAALALRKDLEDARGGDRRAATEAAVRHIVEDINERIRELNRLPTPGPPSDLMPLDLERTLAAGAPPRLPAPSADARVGGTSGGARRAVSAATIPKITSTGTQQWHTQQHLVEDDPRDDRRR